jgi:rare lipoprotein A
LVEALGYQKSIDGQVSYNAPTNYDAGSFAVQIGAFSVSANATRLAASMREQFGKAEVRSAMVDGRQMYRVRVGDFRSLEKAEQAALSFSGNGFPNSFVIAFD